MSDAPEELIDEVQFRSARYFAEVFDEVRCDAEPVQCCRLETTVARAECAWESLFQD